MKIISPKVYLGVYAALIAGFLLNLGLSQVDLGIFNLIIGLSLAFVQMVLVMFYFMHARYSPRLIWLFAVMGFYWLGVFVVLGLNDYISRGWLGPSVQQ
jgi:caa(3)-type oxidase subunit IV